jgi:hypothetical protein
MNETSATPIGTFVWYDLKTREFSPSWRFYTGLLGWGRNDTDRPVGRYSMIRHADRNLGGIVPIGADDAVPPHWIGYVGVGDIEACVAAAEAEGGTVPLPPTLIPGIGLFAVVCDPRGAFLSPFQWTGRSAAALPTGEGAFCWSELLTPDPFRVEPFYHGTFGWTVERGRPGAFGAYWLFRSEGRAVAGMVQRPDVTDYPPHWLHYVRVDRLGPRLEQAAALGGTVLLPPTEIPEEGLFSILRDPGGAMIGFYQGDLNA